MSMLEVQEILEGLKNAQARRMQNNQLALEQQKLQQDQEAQEEELKIRHQELDQQDRHFQITAKAAMALHQMQIAEHKQKLAQDLQSGLAVPGAIPLTPQTSDGTQVVQLPQMGDEDPSTISVNPTAFAKTQADLARIVLEPKEEAEAKKQDAIGKRAQELQDKKDAAAEQRTQEHDQAMLSRTQLMVMKALEAARLKNDADPQNQVDLSNYVQSAMNGGMTQDDVNKLAISKNDKQRLMSMVTSMGGTVLTKDQKKAIDDAKTSVQAINLVDQFLNQIPDSSSNLGMLKNLPGNATKPKLRQISQELDQMTPGITRTTSGLNRVNQNELVWNRNGFKPNLTLPKTDNISKRNDFVDFTLRGIDEQLKGIPAAQRSLIKKEIGALDIPSQYGASTTPALDPIDALEQKYKK